MSIQSDISYAINNLIIVEFIEFDADGYRFAEPHVLGIHKGKTQLLTYDLGVSQWRRFNVDQIGDFRFTTKRFRGQRPNPSGEHSVFDSKLVIAGKLFMMGQEF